METREPLERWSFDKKIPLGMIGALAVFLLAQDWYFASYLSELKGRQQVFDEFMKSSQPQGAQIAVIQEKVSNLNDVVRRLDDHLRNAIQTKER